MTFGADGTTHWSINYNVQHAHYKAEAYSTSDSEDAMTMRLKSTTSIGELTQGNDFCSVQSNYKRRKENGWENRQTSKQTTDDTA